MSENKKYYYLKLKKDFFTSEIITLLESVKDEIMYSNILLKLFLISIKNKKKLFRNNTYTAEIIATITRHQVGTIERVIKIFLELELIDQLPDNILYKKKQYLTDKNQNNGGQMPNNRPPDYIDKRL